MSARSRSLSSIVRGWPGICLVAITYVYFLIFAQFAFLNRLAQLGIADAHLEFVMASMAAGGIAFSLIAANTLIAGRARLSVQIALLICGAAALLSLAPLGVLSSAGVALLIGTGLGLLTVTLVSNLRRWIGSQDAVLKIALGTGLGYFACNIPWLFTASPGHQAIASAVLCGLGILAASQTVNEAEPAPVVLSARETSFVLVLIGFMALVWLDSAAFFIIQNTPSLKAGTWQGSIHLWANALLHLAAAVLSGLLLRRARLRTVLGCAVLSLAVACVLLHQPGQALVASLFYPVGVSFYSVALVAYPSFLSSAATLKQRAFRAALIYSVAGWFGSAMGIGMAQHLHSVPLLFVAFASLLVLGPTLVSLYKTHPRELATLTGAGVIAAGIYLAIPGQRSSPPDAAGVTAAERGRQVYVSEGCISCHSQYVRPNTADVELWGPAETLDELKAQRPPLIGNRRQGPDLSQVGGRRSPLWLKAHFFDPSQVSHASFMPSYGYLFEGSGRGKDLVAYLSGLKSAGYEKHIAMEQGWHLSASAVTKADAEEGAALYGQYCATCHEEWGATRQKWGAEFKRLPPNLHTGPWLHVQPASPSGERTADLARIIKFGIPGTDMPGHEYLSDQDVLSLALWVNQIMVPGGQTISMQTRSGENR